jgi:hypothetical protein
MTFLSPFNVRSPAFFVKFSEAGHKIAYLVLRRVATSVIFLGCSNYDVDNVGEASAAAAALLHGVIDFCRYDKLPTVFIEEVIDNVPDFFVGYVIAAADKHGTIQT